MTPEYLSVIDGTQFEFYDFAKNLIDSQNLSIFQKGRVTAIDIREAVGSKNGKTKTLSFKGLTPKQVKELFLKKLNKQNGNN